MSAGDRGETARAVWELWNANNAIDAFGKAYAQHQREGVRKKWPELAAALDEMPEPTELVRREPDEHPSRAVICPRCGAAEDEPCVTTRSKLPLDIEHQLRISVWRLTLTEPAYCRNCWHPWQDHGLLRTSPNCYACVAHGKRCAGYEANS